jgi:thiol-disulfide isomerase/thioredoxin
MKSLILLLAFFAAAPSPKLIPVDEKAYTQLIAANKGKVTVVSFWATWCVPCRQEVPQLIAMEKRLQAQGVKLVLISADEVDSEIDARRFLDSKSAPRPAYQKIVKNDDKFIEWLEPQWSGALPALFIYDRNGKKVKSFLKETEMKEIEAAVKKAL